MQGLAHQIHMWFRSYVRSDVKGYVKNFGANDVIKERTTIMLKIFSKHLMTILDKLVEGMSQTYITYLFQNKDNYEENKIGNPYDDFEKLAHQWSMHQLSPRTLNMSITSIQSAISKEIMCDPFDKIANKDLEIPNELMRKYQQLAESQNLEEYEEWPKTEKMSERIEFMKNAGKAKLQNLVFPSDSSNNNASTSRCSHERSLKRASKFLPKNTIRILSKESIRGTSDTRIDKPWNMGVVTRWISTRALNKLTDKWNNTDTTDPYSMVRNTSRNTDTATPILSMKTTTIHTPAWELIIEKSDDMSPDTIRRLNAATPMLDGPKLNTDLIPKKRSGSGDKQNNKIIEQFANLKISGNNKNKGRNKIKLGISNSSICKTNTIEIKKKNLFKAINLKTSPKFLQMDQNLKFQTLGSQKSGVMLVKPKLKGISLNKNTNL